jgi:hypothetical protein
METPVQRWFILTSAWALSATGSAKVLSFFEAAKSLSLSDPLFPILSQRELLSGVGLIEIAVAAFLLFARVDLVAKLAVIAWISSLFVLYRVGLSLIGYHGPCSCLGRFGQSLPISEASLKTALLLLLAYLWIGSVGNLVLLRFKIRSTAKVSA